jgi:glycosyltransferase involved in cell wall biosynthesis
MGWRRARGVRQAASRLARLPRRAQLLLCALACCAAPLLLRLAAACAAPLRRARDLRLPRAWPQCAAPPAPRAAQPPPRSDALAAWSAAASPTARAPLRLALVSTYPPTACGLATFAADLRRGVLDAAAAGARPELAAVDVVALHTGPSGSPAPQYPPEARGKHASCFRSAADVAALRCRLCAWCARASPQTTPTPPRSSTRRRAPPAAVSASCWMTWVALTWLSLFQGYSAVLVQHEFGIFGGGGGEFVLELLRPLRCPALLTLHTAEPRGGAAQTAALAQAAAWSAATVSMAHDGCDVIAGWEASFGTAHVRAPCGHIPHGVPPAAPCGGGAYRQALGLPPTAFVFLTGGLISPAKGTAAVVRAFGAALTQAPTAVLLVAGGAHPADAAGGAYLQRVRSDVAASPRLRASVRFLPGYAARADVAALYRAAHVFVAAHTSRGQRSSGTLAAAAAAGAALLATPFPAARELADAGAGLLVPYDDVAALSDAMAALAREGPGGGRLAAMSAAARAAVAPSAWPAVGARYLAAAAAVSYDGSGAVPFGSARESGGAAWLPAGVAATAARHAATVRNGVLTARCTRNAGWVDGAGPGWAAVDTWLARRRTGWGEDATLLKGTFLSHDVARPREGLALRLARMLRLRKARRPAKTVSLRLFEGNATSCGLDAAGAGHAGMRLAQRWAGPLRGASGVRVAAERTLGVAPRSEAAQLAIHLRLTGTRPDDVAGLRALRLTAAVDQLSAAAPAEHWAWEAVRADVQSDRGGWAHDDVDDDSRRAKASLGNGQELAMPHAAKQRVLRLPPRAAVTLRGRDARGCAAQLRIAPRACAGDAASMPPRAAELRLDADGAPHAVAHAIEPRDVSPDALQLDITACFELAWTAEQPPDAPPLCTPAT